MDAYYESYRKEMNKLSGFLEDWMVDEVSWRITTGYEDPQLLMWIRYAALGEFVEEFNEYFATENEFMGNLQQDTCCINLSEMFDQENDIIEISFPKDQARKDGWI